MIRSYLSIAILMFSAFAAHAIEPGRCEVIHGRAVKYSDGPLRIWHIGTHHEYEPDKTSWQRVEAWISAGIPPEYFKLYVTPLSTVELFGDFLVCPTEPFRRGAVQAAAVRGLTHRRYVVQPKSDE